MLKLVLLPALCLAFIYSCSASKENALSALFPSYSLLPYSEGKEGDEGNELDTLQKVERKLRNFVDAIIRQLLPYVIRASSDIQLSGTCMASVFKFVIGMQKLQEWAIRMIDATGKPPSGVMQGTSMSLGDFDECINVRVGRGAFQPSSEEEELFHGKYCTVECKLPSGVVNAINEYNAAPAWLKANTSIGRSKTIFRVLGEYSMFANDVALRFGVCMPSTCGKEDLQSVIGTVGKAFGIPLKVLHCEEKQSIKFTTEQLIVLPLLGIIVLLVLAATAGEIYFSRRRLNTEKKKNKWEEVAGNVSLFRNTRKLFDVSGSTTQPMPMLQGIFFITVALNILAHTYFMYNLEYFFKYSSVMNLLQYLKQFTFSLIANGSNGIENYFFIAGFLIAYMRWRIPLQTAKLDIKQLLLKPYIRMVLLQLLTLSLFFCLPLIGYGPFWKDFVGRYLENCQQRWWINLFFVQNYWKSEETCLYHTWVLAVLMQLYVISVVILWFLIRKPNFGVALVLIAIVIGMAMVGATVFVRELPGALSLYLLDLQSATKMWNYLYIQTYDHLGSFCIGILTGYLLGKHQHSLKLKPVMVLAGWIISAASLMAVIFGLYEYRRLGDTMNPSVSIVYAMLNRNVYALFMSWLVIAGATGNAWFLPDILSWKVLIPWYKLSFLAYALHIVVIYFHVGITRERVYLSHEENIINYFGYLVITYLLSFICYVFFQAPYMYLEEVVSNKLQKHMPAWARKNITDSVSSNGCSITVDEIEKTKRSCNSSTSVFSEDISP